MVFLAGVGRRVVLGVGVMDHERQVPPTRNEEEKSREYLALFCVFFLLLTWHGVLHIANACLMWAWRSALVMIVRQSLRINYARISVPGQGLLELG